MMRKFSVVSVAFLILAIVLYAVPGVRQFELDFFFRGGKDFLADFINPVNSLSLSAGFNPYHSWLIAQSEQGYPPFGYFIYLPFVKLLPHPGMTLAASHGSWQVMAVSYAADFLMLAAFFVSLLVFCRRYRLSWTMAVLIACSGQAIYCLERGNSVFLAVAGVLLFLAYYSSEKVSLKMLAAVGLSVAVALKVVPVLFGILWLNKKDFGFLTVAGVATLILTFVPLLFSDHTIVENIMQLMSNISLHELWYEKYSLSMNPSCVFRLLLVQVLGLSDSLPIVCYGATALKWFCRILAVGGLACAVLLSMPLWKRFFLLAASQILVVVTPQQYVLLFFIPSLLVALSAASDRGQKDHLRFFLFLLFVLVMLPIPLFVINHTCVNFAIQSALVVLGVCVTVGECVWRCAFSPRGDT